MNRKTRNTRKQNAQKKNKKYFHKSEKKIIRNIYNKKGGTAEGAALVAAPVAAVRESSTAEETNGAQNVVNNDKCTIKVGDLVTDNNKLLGIAKVVNDNNITVKYPNGNEETYSRNSGLKTYQYYDILGLLSQIVTNVIKLKNGGSPPEDINNISNLKEHLENAVSLLKSEPNI